MAKTANKVRTAILVLLLVAAMAPSSIGQSGIRTFGGHECTDDCQGHAAGYRWAEARNITDDRDCPPGNSNSFYEGCLAFVDDPYRGADEDDDGHPIP